MHQHLAKALLGLGLLTLVPSANLSAQVTAEGPDLAAMMAAAQSSGAATESKKKDDFPAWKDVSEGFAQVVSTTDGAKSLYGIWTRKKDGQMLAELPSGYASQKHYIAMTVPTGEMFAGLQAGDLYVYWKRFDKRMALMQPDLSMRSTGDQASKDSMKNHYVDRVVLDVPIVCMGPGGQPVIDMDDLLVGKAKDLYGYSAGGLNSRLATIASAKAFPENVELAFSAPSGSGRMQTFHYSISKIPESNGYKPRLADDRVGYFMTTYRDLGKFRDDEVSTRYINRWRLEKADPSLKLSPPKQPLVYTIEHTVPIRYRRWVKKGVEMWNKAFEEVGLSDAVVVQYQDKTTGAHMDKDPEDVRYNFIRWLSNDIGTAIGPSRAHPLTGQILDADVVLTDGWIRHFWYLQNDYLPQAAMGGFSDETLRWFADHPSWDPRVRLASPLAQDQVMTGLAEQRARTLASGLSGANLSGAILTSGSDLLGLAERFGTSAALCMAADGKAREMSVVGLTFAIDNALLGDHDDESPGEACEDCTDDEKCQACKDAAEKAAPSLIDGIPESFVGPMLADLVAHEVGHTLGLRHNFKASSLYTMAEMNSAELKGKKAFAGSVMDYIPVNYNMGDGEVQGDWAMIDVGPYDMWAIEYGYGFGDPEKVAMRSAEPGHAYSTDFDSSGPDPLARRYDFSADPLEFAASQMRVALHQRERVLSDYVADGDSWGKARRGYSITLNSQMSAMSMMANWLGGAFLHKDHKGDPDGRTPIVAVGADKQRKALDFIVSSAFPDAAYGLTPELLQHLTVEKWSDGSNWTALYGDATYPIHDRVAGVQASVLSMLLNPTTLRRVYDNELLVPADQDAFTLPELMDTVSGEIWREVNEGASGSYSVREPMISSLRRNLQQEHLQRLVDLSFGAGSDTTPVANLALRELRGIGERLSSTLQQSGLDTYSRSHLWEANERIAKALDAQFIYNADALGGGGSTVIYLGKEAQGQQGR